MSVLWAKRGWMSGGTFVPHQLFTSGAQGAWYDPSDFSTLFQDAAGTTPVTAVEQPVRLMRDRSGRGNDATAPNDASRPVLRSRYNLLTFSEQFNNADWTKSSVTVTANTDTAPDGTLTADTLEATGANGTTLGSLVLVAGSYTFSVWLRRKTGTGDVDISAHSGGTFVTQTITSSWARYTVTQTLTAGTRTPGIRIVTSGDEVYAWGAQLLTAADQAATGGAYQRVGAETDYDTSNPVWRPYLAFDGSDDFLSAGDVMDLGTENQTTFSGASITGASGTVYAKSLLAAGAGRYAMLRNSSTLTSLFSNNAGTTGSSTASSDTTTAQRVITVSLNRAAGSNVIRANGADVGIPGAFVPENDNLTTTHRFLIGAYNDATDTGQTLHLNGRLYSLIVLGRTATAAELTAMEAWVAGKTGVTL